MLTLGFRHWPLMLKLGIAFGAIMVALLVADRRIEEKFDAIEQRVQTDLGEHAAPSLAAMSRVSYFVPLMRVHIYRYCFFTDPDRRVKIDGELKATREKIITAVADYRKLAVSEAEQQQISEISEKLDKYWWWVVETQKLIHTGADNPSVQKFQAQYTALYNEIEKLMVAMVAHDVQNVERAVQATSDAVAQGRQVLRTAIISAAGLGLFALAVLTVSIALPIRRIASDLETLASGQRVPVRKIARRHDEIGRAEQAAVQTSAYMNGMGEAAQRMAQGDLTVAVNPRSADDAIGIAFANMLGQFQGSVRTIAQSSEQLAAASRTLSTLSTESATQTDSAANAADKVNSGIQTVSQAATSMSQAVRDISAQTSAISAKVTQTSEAAEAMTRAARQADEVADMIARIANQTNILSLNAAVEAARAGDQGRGFAVVASEVNNLAKQTSQATKTITENLRQLSASAAVVATGTQDVRVAAESVACTLQAQSASTVEMDQSLRSATHDSQGIAKAMSGVRQGTSNVHQAANDLAEIAGALNETVATFKV